MTLGVLQNGFTVSGSTTTVKVLRIFIGGGRDGNIGVVQSEKHGWAWKPPVRLEPVSILLQSSLFSLSVARAVYAYMACMSCFGCARSAYLAEAACLPALRLLYRAAVPKNIF